MPNLFAENDPLWFKDAIIYEVPIRAFADSNGDGIGDIRGLTEKLDYLQDLGTTAVWILPFFPSPLRDDGYDVSNYTDINPIYGNLEDFKLFLEAAHERGIRVIIELIINHTSDKHPWFQRARKAPKGSAERNFYVWSDSPEKYPGVRIIFQDFESSNWTWDATAKAYYWHRFYSHQPDLNFDSPDVQKAVFEVLDFWLALGVDGLRLDAVPYLYEREDTNCENLPETHEFLRKLRHHIDARYPNRMLLAEANQWPEDAIEYYGNGDECHMNFHFPLMPRLFMALQMEDSFPIIDILQQTPTIPDNCQWALFLRNHDELTLEMVTDEDRDYMYRVYATDTQARINLGIRRRLSPLMGNNRRRIELMNGLLMSLPGTPVLYYGDEIGMGDNIYLGDRNGVRTPMQWTGDRNAGFSKANPQKLYTPLILDPEYHYEAVNVESQRANPNSLWWWMKRLIATRQRFQAFGRGTFEFLYPENRKVLAFLRNYRDEYILVVANLSRFVQTLELDLSFFKGVVPIEIFGRTPFPAIGDAPYFLSLSPHSFYWFTLQVHTEHRDKQPVQIPTLTVNGDAKNLWTKTEMREQLAEVLPDYLRRCRWYTEKNQTIQTTEILDFIPLQNPQDVVEFSDRLYLGLLKIEYTEGLPQTYILPLVLESYRSVNKENIIASVKIVGTSEMATILDATENRNFLNFIWEAIAHSKRYKGSVGELRAKSEPAITAEALEPHLLRGEHQNTLIVYGDQYIFKLFHKITEGTNPDLEISRFLSRYNSELNTVPVCGTLEYFDHHLMTLGILHQFIPETRDAWTYTLDNLRDYFEDLLVRLQTSNRLGVAVEDADLQINTLSLERFQELAFNQTLNETYLSNMTLLGQRTAELHIALASDSENSDFAPEAFTSFYQRSIYQFMRNLTGQTFLQLRKQLSQFSLENRQIAQALINRQEELLARFKTILNFKITALRTRCHGDYHLRQVLYTGKDFIIIDFEGDPTRPASERKMKRSPLRDIAGMLQSFYEAARNALSQEIESGTIRPEMIPDLEHWANAWLKNVSATFLDSYRTAANQAKFLPDSEAEFQVLLDAYLLEKAVYQIQDALDHHPELLESTLIRVLNLLDRNQDY